MFDNRTGRGLGLRREGIRGCALKFDACARTRQVYRPESQEKCAGGHHLEIDNGLEADAPHALDIASARDAVHQSAENQWSHD